MRDEIHAGLKNAIERGSTLEAAVQSFINAGYNPVEVKEAANSLTSGASSIVNTIKQQQTKPEDSSISTISSTAPVNPQHFMPQQPPAQKPGMSPKKKKVLILLFILLLIVLAAIVGIIFFLEDISKFLNNLLSS